MFLISSTILRFTSYFALSQEPSLGQQSEALFCIPPKTFSSSGFRVWTRSPSSNFALTSSESGPAIDSSILRSSSNFAHSHETSLDQLSVAQPCVVPPLLHFHRSRVWTRFPQWYPASLFQLSSVPEDEVVLAMSRSILRFSSNFAPCQKPKLDHLSAAQSRVHLPTVISHRSRVWTCVQQRYPALPSLSSLSGVSGPAISRANQQSFSNFAVLQEPSQDQLSTALTCVFFPTFIFHWCRNWPSFLLRSPAFFL